MSKICTALVPLQSFSSFKSYSNFNFKIAQKWEILRENNVIFQFLENLNIYLPMSYLSFFQLFNDFFLKNGAKFDTFSLIFEIQPPLLIRFSDAEIPIVHPGVCSSSPPQSTTFLFFNFQPPLLIRFSDAEIPIVHGVLLAMLYL